MGRDLLGDGVVEKWKWFLVGNWIELELVLGRKLVDLEGFILQSVSKKTTHRSSLGK